MSLDAGCGEDGPRRPDKGCRLLIDLSTVDDTPRVNEPKSRAVRGIRTCVVDSDVPSGAKLYTVLVATAERYLPHAQIFQSIFVCSSTTAALVNIKMTYLALISASLKFSVVLAASN